MAWTVASLLLALVLLPVVLPAALAVGLLIWVQADVPAIPHRLEAYYRQVQAESGVPWTALAAWDGVTNGFALPVEAAGTIFHRFYAETLVEVHRRWREWCEAHADPITGRPLFPECESPPGLDSDQVARLWQRAEREQERQVVAHMRGLAQRLDGRTAWLAHNSEEAFRGVLSDGLVPLAGDLFEAYTLQAELNPPGPPDPFVAPMATGNERGGTD